MIQRVAGSGNKSFAYIIKRQGDSGLAAGDIGLIAKVDEVQFLHDGRALLSARMTERFVVTEGWCEEGTGGLHYCKYKLLPDQTESEADIKQAYAEALTNVQKFRDLLDSLDAIPQYRLKTLLGDFPQNTPQLVAWWLSNTLVSLYPDLSDDIKIKLLETVSLKQRLETLNKMLSAFNIGSPPTET
eukprot:TRINITY_DN11257_c0_g1_i1.p1 TRINITY_DN11257_c0_g1~~TRINITY_DN11257_c0_g1_i1.p1  ORF type:complete len:186 (-),score=37.53 TRINITY_DN11257_c0_g1_i1:31-588(-)